MSVRFRYGLYGLTLGCDRALPFLAPASPHARTDIILRPGHLPGAGRQPETGAPRASPRLFEDGGRIHIYYADGTRFVLDTDRNTIWFQWPDHYRLEDALPYLLNPVLGYWLASHGCPCLHASAVAWRGGAVAFVGATGAGKSTLAAAFAARGVPVLCDDVLVLRHAPGAAIACAGYPLIKLWPAALARIPGHPPDTVPLAPSWDKRALPLLDMDLYADGELPLTACYVLEAAGRRARRYQTQRMRGHTAAAALLGNSYVGDALDRPARATELELITTIAGSLPVYGLALDLPRDFERLLAHLDGARAAAA